MIKAIIFDYFGVVCSDEYWRFVKTDKNVESADFVQLSNAVNMGNMHWSDFISTVAQKTGSDPQKIKQLYETEQINPSLIAYITKLHDTYKMGLLTNAHYEFLEPRIKAAGLDKVFDAIVMSSRVGIIKPDPKIYEYMLEKLGVKPAEAVHIDDITRHVEGAKQAGLHAILYRNFGQMKRELENLLAANR